ncbi:tetratricopeptide repeat-containing sensor histidine kinase [Paraflavitalea pollutisoli]|uniref:tetratricopeptide repeat-containing sensor histidine kinase n=1 Tax=Paraflavitalea pollutisoli TaxID=3034143 RepID=UPI0023EA97FB|nr:sensor histidine kinase [Paraflavitalea sp. H1-2-19X]
MRNVFLLIGGLLFGALSPVRAQQALADSVKKLLDQPAPDSVHALHLVYHAMYMEPVDMEQAHVLYQQAVEFSVRKHIPYYAGMALRFEATPYHIAGNRAMEINNLQRAIAYLSTVNTTKAKKELGNAYTEVGSWYRYNSQYDSAIHWFIKGLGVLESVGANLTTQYYNMAALYQQLKLPQLQKEYALKSLAAARKSGTPRNIYAGNLVLVHYYNEVGPFDSAKVYLDSAFKYFDPQYEFRFACQYHLLAGITFQNLKMNDSAIVHYNQTYDYAKANHATWNMVEPKIQIGHIYYGDKQYAQAEVVTKEALALAEKDSIPNFMQECHGLLTKIYEETGRFKEANEHIWKYVELKDSIEAGERKTFALDLEKKYETQKKDNELLRQQATIRQKDTINYILIGSAIALILILVLSYRNYRNKRKLQLQRINELETEKQLTATEAVLKGEEQERTRLAKDLHDGLGGMLSGIKHSFTTMQGNLIMTPENQAAFERSMDMLDSSIREMRRVAHNMMPEVLVKYGLDTALRDYCIDINKSGALRVDYQSIGLEQAAIEQSKAIAVYRIAQELINNTIKHAQATHAIVQLSLSNGQLSLTVEDDGKGFEEALTHQSGGIGWYNIRNRVEFLKGKLDINSAPGKGSSILVEVEA